MIRIELAESEQRQLLRFLDDQVKLTIRQQHEITKAVGNGNYSAEDKNQLYTLTKQLKWFDRFIKAIGKGKKI